MADQQKADRISSDSLVRKDHNATALIFLQGLCGVALVVGLKILPTCFSLDLIAHPVATIRLALGLTIPTVIMAYTTMTIISSSSSSFFVVFVKSLLMGLEQTLRCVGGGLLSLPAGTIMFALLAVAFGAPTSLQYASQTLHWACLMSVLVVLPAAIVLGSSWPNWQRIFAFTRPRGGVERAVCIPAHGAMVGAWVGAFPMPLDWERPWQEWPISCTYGAAGGYLLGLTISILIQCLHSRGIRLKTD